jgi:hypothetical protein
MLSRISGIDFATAANSLYGGTTIGRDFVVMVLLSCVIGGGRKVVLPQEVGSYMALSTRSV